LIHSHFLFNHGSKNINAIIGIFRELICNVSGYIVQEHLCFLCVCRPSVCWLELVPELAVTNNAKLWVENNILLPLMATLVMDPFPMQAIPRHKSQ
jgi:hypothetical protein